MKRDNPTRRMGEEDESQKLSKDFRQRGTFVRGDFHDGRLQRVETKRPSTIQR